MNNATRAGHRCKQSVHALADPLPWYLDTAGISKITMLNVAARHWSPLPLLSGQLANCHMVRSLSLVPCYPGVSVLLQHGLEVAAGHKAPLPNADLGHTWYQPSISACTISPSPARTVSSSSVSASKAAARTALPPSVLVQNFRSFS